MPTLLLTPDCISYLEKYLPALLADLRRRVTVDLLDVSSAPADDPLGIARQVAESLDGLMCSSDADVPYWACVLRDLGDDPWRAFGTTPDEDVSLSGWKSPRLESRDVPALQALANLSDDSFEEVEEYVEPDDFAAAERLLEETGPRLNLRLAFPEESTKLVLNLAKKGSDHIGVVTFSVET